jgi:hypothetical protein
MCCIFFIAAAVGSTKKSEDATPDVYVPCDLYEVWEYDSVESGVSVYPREVETYDVYDA